MARRAKTLTDPQFKELLQQVGATSLSPLRDYVVMLFSFKAGLRAGEIAGISWRDVTDASGRIGTLAGKEHPEDPDEYEFTVPKHIAKKGHMRVIPMHPALKAALEALADEQGRPLYGNVIKGSRSEQITPNALQRYLSRLYTKNGLVGCSSHSGRRTFITKAARAANEHGCSIRDVQGMAGHKFIDTTEHYIEASPHRSKLVRSL